MKEYFKSKLKENPTPAPVAPTNYQPKTMNINVNGEKFVVSVSYNDDEVATRPQQILKVATPSTTNSTAPQISGNLKEITSPLEGKFFLKKESSEKGVKVGDHVKVGDTVAYIEAMKVINAIAADKSGQIVEICFKDGDDIEEDDVIMKIQ